MKLENKRARVTGGTRGIGAAIALDLARQGVCVAINGRHDDQAAKQILGQIQDAGGQATTPQGSARWVSHWHLHERGGEDQRQGADQHGNTAGPEDGLAGLGGFRDVTHVAFLLWTRPGWVSRWL